MKKLILIILVLATTSFARTPDCTMFNSQACIAASDTSEFVIYVHYSNMRICGLEMLPALGNDLADQSMIEGLAEDLKVLVADSSVGGVFEEPIVLTEAHDKLSSGVGPNTLYVAPVSITSKSGEPLDQVIRTHLGQNGKLIVVPVLCN
jgi:hypothetical protein